MSKAARAAELDEKKKRREIGSTLMGHSNIKLYGIGGEASDGKWAHRDQPHHFARVAAAVYEKKSLNVNLKLSSVARLLTGLPLRSSLSSSGALAAAVGGVRRRAVGAVAQHSVSAAAMAAALWQRRRYLSVSF